MSCIYRALLITKSFIKLTTDKLEIMFQTIALGRYQTLAGVGWNFKKDLNLYALGG